MAESENAKGVRSDWDAVEALELPVFVFGGDEKRVHKWEPVLESIMYLISPEQNAGRHARRLRCSTLRYLLLVDL